MTLCSAIAYVLGIATAYLLAWYIHDWQYSAAVTNIFVAIGTMSLALVAIWRDVWPSFFIRRQREADATVDLSVAWLEVKTTASALMGALEMRLGGELNVLNTAKGSNFTPPLKIISFDQAVVGVMQSFFKGDAIEAEIHNDFIASSTKYRQQLVKARSLGLVNTYDNRLNMFNLALRYLGEQSNAEVIEVRYQTLQKAFSEIKNSNDEDNGVLV